MRVCCRTDTVSEALFACVSRLGVFPEPAVCPGDLAAILQKLCGCAWTLHSPSLSDLGANGCPRGSEWHTLHCLPPFPLKFIFKIFIFLYLAALVLVAACRIFNLHDSRQVLWLRPCELSRSRWDLISWPGIESGPLPWEQSLSYSTTRGVLSTFYLPNGFFEELIQVFSTPPSFFPLTFSYWYVILFFWPCQAACRILVLLPAIEPMPLQWKGGVLTTGPQGKSLEFFTIG